jgi:hypothetical protein
MYTLNSKIKGYIRKNNKKNVKNKLLKRNGSIPTIFIYFLCVKGLYIMMKSVLNRVIFTYCILCFAITKDLYLFIKINSPIYLWIDILIYTVLMSLN